MDDEKLIEKIKEFTFSGGHRAMSVEDVVTIQPGLGRIMPEIGARTWKLFYAAKAAGALWDKAAKSWYVGPRADAAKLGAHGGRGAAAEGSHIERSLLGVAHHQVNGPERHMQLLRHRLVRFLVERMNFTALAWESGFPETIAVNDYIHSRRHDLQQVQVDGMTMHMGECQEMADLLELMDRNSRLQSNSQGL